MCSLHFLSNNKLLKYISQDLMKWFIPMCSSRKNPYPPHGRSLEIPKGRGGGSKKLNLLEAMYENKLEFPGGKGVQNKKPSMWEYRYFPELHNLLNNRREHTGSHLVKFTYIITFYSLKQSLNFWRKKKTKQKAVW